jgi:hypothetical protein
MQLAQHCVCWRVLVLEVLNPRVLLPESQVCVLGSRVKVKKAIPVTGRGGVKDYEMFRVPHCVDNWLTGGGKVVSPTHRSRSTSHKHFSASVTHF